MRYRGEVESSRQDKTGPVWVYRHLGDLEGGDSGGAVYIYGCGCKGEEDTRV